MASEPLLETKELKVVLRNGRSTVKLVDGLSFSVHSGKVLGLVGESGCGKSLTCLAILNLLPRGVVREAGEIRLKGEWMECVPDARWRGFRGKYMAVILQNPMSAFDPVFTIGKHFMETIAAHCGAGDRNSFSLAEDVLREVGFSDPVSILRLYPFQMSGGMLQRVMIALALVHEAPLLIADEPTTDLDVVSQSRILDLLDRLRRDRGMGILLVTHDLSVVARMADHVAVMRDGKLVESASAGTVFERPTHPYTRALLDAHFRLHRGRGGMNRR